MTTDPADIYACYRSGQIPEEAWQEHQQSDAGLRDWLSREDMTMSEIDVAGLVGRLRMAEVRIAELEEFLRSLEQETDEIRQDLIDNLTEPERSAFWKAVRIRDAARSLLNKERKG